MSLKSSRKSNVDDRVGKYNHAVVGLELKKTDLEQVIGDLEFKIKELNLQIEGQEAEISKRGERIISLSDTSREIEALIEKSKGNASKLSKDMHSKIKISESIIDDKKREYDKIKAETEVMYVRLTSLVGQTRVIQSQRDDIAKEMAHLHEEMGSLLIRKNWLVKEIEDKKIERGSIDEAYRQYNLKKIELDRREIDLKIYEERLRKRSKDAGINLKMKLK